MFFFSLQLCLCDLNVIAIGTIMGIRVTCLVIMNLIGMKLRKY